jgi:hypothetical protein
MATITTGALPSGAFVSGNEIVGNQGGVTKRLTLSTAGLSDVEQSGLWTPTLYGSTTTGTTTYAVQSGTYSRIGEKILINFSVLWSNITGTGGARIGGLPFNAKNFSGTYRFGLSVAYYNSLAIPNGASLGGYLQDNTNFIVLINYNETTGNDLTDMQTELTTAGEIYGSITYILG